MSIGVKNEKRIPKEDTPLASEATFDVAKLAYVTSSQPAIPPNQSLYQGPFPLEKH